MNSTSADPPGGLQPFRPTGKLRHERPQCRLNVLQARPAETVDRLRPHSRVGLDARDYLVLGDIREGDAADLLAAADQRSAEPTSDLQSLMRISYAAFSLTQK